MTVNYMAKFNASESDFPVRLLKFEQRVSSMFVDHLCCADDNQQDYLVEHCSVPRAKITVLMNLPNPQLFRQTATMMRKQDDAFRIVYHGTIAHRLGIDLIVRAVAKAAEQIPVELWMYGAGDFLPEALALSSELGLNSRAHFSRSFFPVEQIPEIVSGMDLGIIGNRRNLACDKYMLPVKLLEYVYLGVPVVAPRLEVIRRYFDDSMVCFYEPENVEQMAEAIVALYRDSAERARIARAATAFYRVHNIEAQAATYLDLITDRKVRPYAVA
jgi:glycosyltransferase involved in cell wall biosynthesis